MVDYVKNVTSPKILRRHISQSCISECLLGTGLANAGSCIKSKKKLSAQNSSGFGFLGQLMLLLFTQRLCENGGRWSAFKIIEQTSKQVKWSL